MTNSALAARYAGALADVVTKPASAVKPHDAAAQLNAFVAALGVSRELHEILHTPAVPASRKKAVVARIADMLGLARPIRNFLFVLVDHRRVAALSEIARVFEQILDERLGFARAEVSSARELAEPLRAALTADLERLTGKRIRTQFAVDESLIGGVLARIGSTVYDGSVRGRLEALGRRLASEN
jgi:F-type H+-transporting ATPase subunit delta